MPIARFGFIALHREGSVYFVTRDGWGVSGERFFATAAEAVKWFEHSVKAGEF